MKKLALALLCLVSVAFFASCDHVENPEPTISVLNEVGYLTDSAVIEADQYYNVGFVMASNPETQKPLANFKLYIDDEIADDTVIDGTEFTYRSQFGYFTRTIIGDVILTATVTDADGKSMSTSMHLWVNKEESLTETPITWVRRGQTVQNETEMAEYGLKWIGSYKEVFATITPLDNYTLYVTDDAEYASIETASQKANFVTELLETARPVEQYRNISTNADADYHDVLVVMGPEGVCNLVNFTHADIETGEFGTQITITGSVK
jgi:hypothetical protein